MPVLNSVSIRQLLAVEITLTLQNRSWQVCADGAENPLILPVALFPMTMHVLESSSMMV